MSAPETLGRRIAYGLTMLLVSGFSLMLLLYVGYGEARRTYQNFHLEKLAAQGRLVQSAMESYLRDGLPLKQFVGFATLARPLVDGDDAVTTMAVYDQWGRRVFVAGDTAVDLLPAADGESTNHAGFELREDDNYFQVVLPLRSRFETVGWLAIDMPRSMLTQRLSEAFSAPILVMVSLSLAFALFVVVIGADRVRNRLKWLHLAYAATFLTMAAVVIGTLVSLYSEGAQAKSQALANSLGQRLKDIVEYNLNLGDFVGLDRLFADYRRLNADISSAGLTVNDVIVAHIKPDLVGKPWVSEGKTYEYAVDLTPPGHPTHIRVAVALPAEVVWHAVVRSVKNFAALFVASAFLAGLFLQIAATLQQARQTAAATIEQAIDRLGNDTALNLVRPVFFVAVFLEHLTYSFLPQFVHKVAAASALPAGLASAPFMVYYVCFALTLIPAGHLSPRVGPRALVYGGLMLAAGGLITLALPLDYWFVTAARALAGIGQGMLFIGVQSYILAVASPERRTQAAGIIVFGFQGGMISGTAIGSLLVIYMGPEGVFSLGATIAVIIALYTITVVPPAARTAPVGNGLRGALRDLGRDIREVWHSAEFLKTMFLIGIPAKAVLTGIVVFALPLLLAQKNYPQEDIGQIIMLYAVGVLFASAYASRFVDRVGRTSRVLFWGSVGSGMGLLTIGMIDWLPVGAHQIDTELLIAGVIAVGIAHGLINAPVVTHVADLELSSRIGINSATATYRFLERIGHAAGPIVVAQLFFFGGQSTVVLAWLGAVIILLGVLFVIRVEPAPPSREEAAA
jgi:MFS family permease